MPSGRTVPNELLVDIFIHSLRGQPLVVRRERYRAAAPINLLLVCSNWRHLALQIPELWNNLHFTSTVSYSDRDIATITMILSRAATLPLSLKIDHGVPSNFLTEIILSNAHRCKALSFDSSRLWLQPFLTLSHDSITLLRVVDIIQDCAQPWEPNLMPYDITVFDGAHNLRAFTLSHSSLPERPFNALLFQLPWAQLTDLGFDTSPIELGIGLRILSQCARLQRCRLGLTDPKWHIHHIPPHQFSQVVLPNLTELRIDNYTADFIHFLHHLTVPMLNKFHLGCRCSLKNIRDEDWEYTFVLFFSRSPSLTDLVLTLVPPAHIVVAALNKVPSLERLQVFMSYFDRVAFKLILDCIVGGKTLPILRQFGTSLFDHIQILPFLNVLGVCWKRGDEVVHTISARTVDIYVAPGRTVGEKASERVKELRGEGYDINLIRRRYQDPNVYVL